MDLPHPSRLLAVGAVTAGTALFGTALGGIATVDGELRAAVAPAPAPATDTLRVRHPATPVALDCERDDRSLSRSTISRVEHLPGRSFGLPTNERS